MSRDSLLYLSGSSIPEVSKVTGIPLSTLRFRFKKMGILRNRADGVRIAAKNGKLGKNKGMKRVFSESHKKNISIGRLRGAEISAKGTRINPRGYIEHTRGANKGRGQHCVLMEHAIGRKLFIDECVHHIDGDRANNDIENLKVMTKSEHASLHATKNYNKRRRNQHGQFE